MSAIAAVVKEFKKIAQLVPALFYGLDLDQKYLWVNELCFQMSGTQSYEKDFAGKTPYDLYPKEMAENIVQHHKEVIRTGKMMVTEESIRNLKTGEIIYFTVTIAPLQDDNGSIIGTIGISINITPEKQKAEHLKKVRIFEHIEKVAQIIPAPFYWLDLKQGYLGVNDFVLRVTGTRSFTENFAGKTPYDLYPKDMAENIVQHHKDVIQTGKMLSVEEAIKDVSTRKTRCFSAFIAPLYDDDNNILGTIGISIETTAEKEAELLKLENELQQVQLQEQDKFKKLTDQVVHDIRSPLASLLMIVKSCKDIPETERVALREAAIGIGDIANNLLNRYKQKEVENIAKEEAREPMIVSLVLYNLLTDKKYQYQNLPVRFSANFSQEGTFAFINAEPSSFKRMVSNLINNAVDALEGKSGKITLKLYVEERTVKIVVQDNGKGMPQDLIDKIMQKVAITSGKVNGHGIGLMQVRETLERNHGEMTIDSKVDKGTKITLTFPLVQYAKWVAEQISIRKGDIVVILDDDVSIHGAWKARFKPYAEVIELKHFKIGEGAIAFINALPTKDKILLLADFELLKQELNGIHVIERTGVKRSILVTSHYANLTVRDLASKAGTKILPKQLASEVPIVLEESVASNLKKVDLIIIDDNQLFADSLAMLFNGKVVDTYYHPVRFLDKVAQYPKDTKICMDNDLSHKITGVELAKQLHDAGYTHLYLLSGTDFASGEIPDYLTIINKSDMDKFAQVLG